MDNQVGYKDIVRVESSLNRVNKEADLVVNVVKNKSYKSVDDNRVVNTNIDILVDWVVAIYIENVRILVKGHHIVFDVYIRDVNH